MDNYLDELISVAKLPYNEICNDIKIIMVGNKVIYVCNFIKILDYSTEKLVIKIPKNTLEILGEELYISQINKGEIIIKGKINSCSFGDGINEKNKKL